jgi:hypothetical protein
MKTRNLTLTLTCAAVLAALAATPVLAQTATGDGPTATTTNHEATRLSGEFTAFAGSDANAEALVSGLRNGSEVTLEDTVTNPDGTTSTTETTFQPATGKMGYGNVKIALSLAEATLAQAGITDPTADELAAALNGGTLVLADGTSIDLKGVLAERAAGEGWGQIAKENGFKLGEVMRSPKAVGSAAAGEHAHGKVARVELAAVHPEHPAHPDHVAKADRPERPERPSRPERPERPEHPDRPDHAGRPGG